MFSDHLKKFDEMPYRTLLWVAAGLVFVCQLVAVGFVADEQVTKAKIRDYQRQAEMQAIAQCMDNAAGPARQSCIQQARVVASTSLPPAEGSAAQGEAPDVG
jgi:glycerol-3-phosphate dehydrogenase